MPLSAHARPRETRYWLQMQVGLCVPLNPPPLAHRGSWNVWVVNNYQRRSKPLNVWNVIHHATNVSMSPECDSPIVWHPGTQLMLCFRLTTATHVFTRLMAPMSTILHRYVVGMLRYLDDWLILTESRTTGIQAKDRLLQVCAELGLQVIAESRPWFHLRTWLLSACRSSQFGSLQNRQRRG